MSAKVWCVKGEDPFAAYRSMGQQANQYRYGLGRVSFWSSNKRIPSSVFHKMIRHFGSCQHTCKEIRALEDQYQISNVLFDASVNVKQTITGGSHLHTIPKLPACFRQHAYR